MTQRFLIAIPCHPSPCSRPPTTPTIGGWACLSTPWPQP
eukprot:CAMPEP_0202842872 /NCGR_PEP_ID=MMETSP1389-20130828/62614_1 /ASSEMBLY_ACC=CAM_ASM_000865 /TAXON_ID=302021 /ORGANISM="Rhodomonas sp., Strain CCMP768" /LENGTH=38 /DNA_ID= /DNA_START= /DNA_END= /DNA_ORIENTATION=